MQIPGRSEGMKREGRVEGEVLGGMHSTLKICTIASAQAWRRSHELVKLSLQ